MFIQWFIDAKTILIPFLKNPIIYWAIIIALLLNSRRKRAENVLFHHQVTPAFLEWEGTLSFTVLSSIILSIITLTTGFVITYEVVLILCIVTFLLTYIYHAKYASAVYTIGITYLLLMPSIYNHYENGYIILTSMLLLIGIFLIIEGMLLYKAENHHFSPELSYTKRGVLFGQLRLNKLSFIPFFIFVPAGTYTPIFPIWPSLLIDGESYHFILLPFLFGISYLFSNDLPKARLKQMAIQTVGLGAFVILFAIIFASFPLISLAVLIISIIGRLFIQFYARFSDYARLPYFHNLNDKVSVLYINKRSPFEKLGIQIGDTIVQLNENKVTNVEQFYNILSDEKIIHQLHIVDQNDNEYIVNCTIYVTIPSRLGVVLI